jgi:hypothetical protein
MIYKGFKNLWSFNAMKIKSQFDLSWSWDPCLKALGPI